jgi:hypothetical protein
MGESENKYEIEVSEGAEKVLKQLCSTSSPRQAEAKEFLNLSLDIEAWSMDVQFEV